MVLEIEQKAKDIRELLLREDVKMAMRVRCDEDGHAVENCCSPLLRIYSRCKWCGDEEGRKSCT